MLSAACRACSESWIWRRASPGLPFAASAKVRSTASQNCATEFSRYWRCSGVRSATATCSSFASASFKSEPHPLELRRPRGQGIGLVVVQHVAHGQRQGVEVVLNAQQLQRVLAVAVDQVVLQLPQAGDLPGDVPGVGHHGGQSDDQPQDKSRSWRPMRRRWARHAPRIQRAGVKCHCGAVGRASALSS